MAVVRNAEVISIRDNVPGPFTNREQQDLVGVSEQTDQDAKFAISGNGRPDRDKQLAGMLRARPRRVSTGGAIAEPIRHATNLQRLGIDSRGNLLDGYVNAPGYQGVGDLVDIMTSRTFLFIAAALGVYYVINPNQVPWRKKA